MGFVDRWSRVTPRSWRVKAQGACRHQSPAPRTGQGDGSLSSCTYSGTWKLELRKEWKSKANPVQLDTQRPNEKVPMSFLVNQCHSIKKHVQNEPMSFFVENPPIWSDLTMPNDLTHPVQFQMFSIATSKIQSCSGLSMVFRLQKTQRPQSFPADHSEGTPVYHVWWSTDTWLLHPEFQSSQQTVSLPYFPSSVAARPIHAFRPQYAAQDCREVDNPLVSTQYLGPPSQLYEVPTSSSWICDTTFFEDEHLCQNLSWPKLLDGQNKMWDSWWIRFINSLSHSTFPILGYQGASPRRWGLLNTALGTAPAAPAGSAGSTGCNGRGGRGGHRVLRMNRTPLVSQTWTWKMVCLVTVTCFLGSMLMRV